MGLGHLKQRFDFVTFFTLDLNVSLDHGFHLMMSFMPWPMYMTRVQVRTTRRPTMLSRHHIHTCTRGSGAGGEE